MIDWFFATLKQYPEIAIFLTLAIGYYFGKFNYRGLGLGAVTATLLAGVLIGQIGITISQPLKAFAFLMFLFAVGYAVGPQFVRGVAKDGVPQAIFSVVQCLLCLGSAVVICKFAGYDVGGVDCWADGNGEIANGEHVTPPCQAFRGIADPDGHEARRRRGSTRTPLAQSSFREKTEAMEPG